MVGFLAKLGTLILTPFVELIFKRISRAISEYIRAKKVREEIAAKNKAAREQQEKAINDKEREDALKDLANRF